MRGANIFAGALIAGLAIALNPVQVHADHNVYSETVITGAGTSVDTWKTDEKKRKNALRMLRPELFAEEHESTDVDDTETTEQTTEAETAEVSEESFYIMSIAPNYVNVRTQPSDVKDTIIGKMYTGAVGIADAVVEGVGGAWYHMSSGTLSGYVRSDFFQIVDEETAYNNSASTLIGTVNGKANNLYVRSQASVESTPYALIARGTQVVIIGEEGDFYMIQLDEACVGYVHKNYIDVTRKYATAISLSEERAQAEESFQAQESVSVDESISASIAASQSAAQSAAESLAAAQEAEAAAEASRQAAIQASVEEAARQSAAAAAAEASKQAAAAQTTTAVTVVGVQAAYVGGTKYVGQTVSGAELAIYGIFSDGSIYAVDGWGCNEVGVPLKAGANTFTVNYKGFLFSFTVNAQEKPTTVAPTTNPTTEAPTTQTPVTPTVTEPSTTVTVTEAPTSPEDSKAVLRQNIVAYALQFVGNPYKYGGTDLVNGSDCSGFTMSIYAHFNMSITRTSRSQAAAGAQIALTAVQPGDLVFYTDVNTGIIGHVALYIGNGQIIHAATAQLGVIISDMYYRQPYKAVTFIG